MPKRATSEEPSLLEQIEAPAARALATAGVECFAEKGFHPTTTRDIAKRAGLSPAAVYVYFPTKAELLYTLSKIGHESALEALERAPAEELDPARRLGAMVSAFAAWHARNHRLARVVQYELDALPQNRRAEIVAIRQRFRACIEFELEAGLKAGRFSIPDVPGATLATLSLCIDVARWYSPSGSRSPDDLGALYGDLILRMVGAGD